MTRGRLSVVLLLGYILNGAASCLNLGGSTRPGTHSPLPNKLAFLSSNLRNPYSNHNTHDLRLHGRTPGRHETYTKKDVVSEVADKLNKTQKEVAMVVDEFLATIKRHLANNAQVSLTKFGVFKNSLRGERRMRNLQTGEIFTAKPVHVPSLKFYDTFKAEVKNKLKSKDKKSYLSYNY